MQRAGAVGAHSLRVRRDGVVEGTHRAGGTHGRGAGIVVVGAQVDEVEARRGLESDVIGDGANGAAHEFVFERGVSLEVGQRHAVGFLVGDGLEQTAIVGLKGD